MNLAKKMGPTYSPHPASSPSVALVSASPPSAYSLFEKIISHYSIPVLFLALYAWRPWILGFYSDDWSLLVAPFHAPGVTPYSFELFKYYLTVFANRPGVILQDFLFVSFFQESTFLWHLFRAGLMLASALVMRSFMRELIGLFKKDENDLVPTMASLLWLAVPWTPGATIWPCTSVAIVSTLTFLGCGVLLFKSWRTEGSYKIGTSLFVSSLLLFYGYASYEPFYLQYGLFILFGLLAGIPARKGWRALIIPFVAFSLMQALAIVSNRLFVNGFTPQNTIDADYQNLFINNVLDLPVTLGRSFPEVSTIVKFLSVGFSLFLAINIASSIFRTARRSTIAMLGATLVGGLGLLMAIAIFSVVGYQIIALGPLSRTTLGLTLWLIISVALLLSSQDSGNSSPLWLRRAPYVFMLGILLCLGYSTAQRTREWGAAAALQEEVIKQFPIAEVLQTEPTATIVYICPNVVNEAFVFLASYDLVSAISIRYQSLSGRSLFPHISRADERSRSAIYGNEVKWDGERLYENTTPLNGNPIVYIWDYYQRKLWKQTTPFVLRNGVVLPYGS